MTLSGLTRRALQHGAYYSATVLAISNPAFAS
jgi:hypothetical protein